MVWERIGAATGIVFVVLFMIAFGLELHDFPDPGLVGADEIVMFIEAHQTRLGLVAILYAVSWTAFLWFMGSLRSRLAAVEPSQRLSSVAFGAGILTATLSLVMSGLRAEIVLADFTTAVEAAVTGRWALYDASGGFLGITPFPRAVTLGSASLVVLRFGGLPRWLGWLGVVSALVNLVGGFDYLAPSNVTYTGHPLADLISFVVWVLLASGTIVWSPSPASRSASSGRSGQSMGSVKT
jgi:hypothetical protein